MSQNLTTVPTPFTLGPSPTDLNATHYSSRLPLFSTMSEKVLRQQTPANRSGTDLESTSIPPDLSLSSNAPAFSVSIPNTHASGSNSNIGASTLKLSLLNEPSDSSPPIGPQGPPEPNHAAANDDAAHHLRYLTGPTSIVGPSTPAYDVPPAYRPNNEYQ